MRLFALIMILHRISISSVSAVGDDGEDCVDDNGSAGSTIRPHLKDGALGAEAGTMTVAEMSVAALVPMDSVMEAITEP